MLLKSKLLWLDNITVFYKLWFVRNVANARKVCHVIDVIDDVTGGGLSRSSAAVGRFVRFFCQPTSLHNASLWYVIATCLLYRLFFLETLASLAAPSAVSSAAIRTAGAGSSAIVVNQYYDVNPGVFVWHNGSKKDQPTLCGACGKNRPGDSRTWASCEFTAADGTTREGWWPCKFGPSCQDQTLKSKVTETSTPSPKSK